MTRDHLNSHDTAQVCLNGHIATRSFHDSPPFREDFCTICGEATTIKCPNCSAEIRGRYRGVFSTHEPPPPAYCHACGKPHLWTCRRIDAAKELADEIEGITEGEKLLLKASIDELVKDTPKTQLASIRFKKYAAKGGQAIVSAMRDILVDVVSETARKLIWG